MDKYLWLHYKGKYRIRADYDQSTNDFQRDSEGNLDESQGDFYMSGSSGIRVVHGIGSELACYIPKLQKGNNVLRNYYEATTGKSYKNKSMDVIVKTLKESGHINDCDIMSVEVFFTFDAEHLDALAPIIKLKTSGASISPFSTRNLPKKPYTIPKTDMDRYKKAKDGLSGLEIARLNEEFIAKNFDSDFKTNLRKEMLKPIQYFHRHGYWDKYCKFIKGSAS